MSEQSNHGHHGQNRSERPRPVTPLFLCTIFAVILVSIVASGLIAEAIDRETQRRHAKTENMQQTADTTQGTQDSSGEENNTDKGGAEDTDDKKNVQIAADTTDKSEDKQSQKDESAGDSDSATAQTPADPRCELLELRPNDPPNVTENPDDVKTVYLTFDDGPSKNTPRVLDILDKYNVKATFFVIGINTDYLPYIKTAYDKGHTIGLHTYNHKYEELYSSDEAYLKDLSMIADTVKQQIGFVPAFVRFPGGASNTVSTSYCSGIMTRMTQKLHELGYQYYDWNVSSGDGSAGLTADELVNNSETEQFNKVMILFHDSATKDATVDALPRIIEYYKERGYTFSAIDRNSIAIQHGVAN